MKRPVFALLLLLSISSPGVGNAAGAPDVTFGDGGVLVKHLDRTLPFDREEASSLLIDSQGRYVTVGQQRCGSECVEGKPASRESGFIARYLPDGSPDPEFNAGEAVYLHTPPFASLDEFELDPEHVFEQPDGKLLFGGSRWISGQWSSFVCRLLPDGNIDLQFAESGCRDLFFVQGKPGLAFMRGMALQDDGRVLALARPRENNVDPRSYMLVRLMPDGSDDTSFGDAECPNCAMVLSPPGLANAVLPSALAIDPNEGSIVIGGSINSPPFRGLVGFRVASSGAFDWGNMLDFSSLMNGDASHNLVDVHVAEDSSVTLFGTAQSNTRWLVVGKLQADGTPDPAFGAQGRAVYSQFDYSDAGALGMQNDGKLIFSGGSNNECFVMRADGVSGAFDPGFGDNGMSVLPMPSEFEGFCWSVNALVVNAEHVLVAGSLGDTSAQEHDFNLTLFRLERGGRPFSDGFED